MRFWLGVVFGLTAGGVLAVLLLTGGFFQVRADCQDEPCENPPCCNGDVNGDSRLNIADALYLLSYLFKGGPEPIALAQSEACLTAEECLQLKQILQYVSVVNVPSGEEKEDVPTVLFSGVNVQIVNGLGATNGNPEEPGALSDSVTGSNDAELHRSATGLTNSLLDIF